MFDFLSPFFTLMSSGGDVLLILFFVGAVLVESIAERVYFYNKVFMSKAEAVAQNFSWDENDDFSFYKRQKEVSKLKVLLKKRISHIEVITFMCPLFGLLGTVTGMIAVFDVMAHKGLGNPRLMASGVSQATLPTMVSMVIALVGLFGLNYLKSKKAKLEIKLEETFKLES